MSFRRFLLPILSVIALSFAAVPAQAEFSTQQKQEIGDTVREYLLANPEVLVEVMRELERKRAAAANIAQKEALAALGSNMASPMTPVSGNAKGDITIIEFFDYQCSYCKRAFPHLRSVMEEDKGVRVVMKEFPVLGPESALGARAALAVWKLAPAKYMAFHTSLMNLKGRLSENKVIATATELGLKEADVRKAMASPAVQQELQTTAQIAHQLNITGTPAFVVGSQVFPGYMELADLKQVVAAARAKAKK